VSAFDYLLSPADFNHLPTELEDASLVCIPLQCANNPDTPPRGSYLKILSINKKAINLKGYHCYLVDEFGIEIAILL
jgi:hypothetical protein